MNSTIGLFKKNIINENPLFIRFLGISAALVVTKTVSAAIALGISAIAVLTLSELVLSLLGKIIPNETKLIAYILVVCGFVTAAELVVDSYFPQICGDIGLFIPLLAVNCAVVTEIRGATERSPLEAVIGGFSTGLGYSVALLIVALARLPISLLFDGAAASAVSFILIGAIAAGFTKIVCLAENAAKKSTKAVENYTQDDGESRLNENGEEL